MAVLRIDKGPGTGRSFEVSDKETLIGRLPMCHVVLDSHTVSRQHARIIHQADGYYLEDLGSVNGTGLNGQKIDRRTRLSENDAINIYDIRLRFEESVGVTTQIANIEENGNGSQSGITMNDDSRSIVSQITVDGSSPDGIDRNAQLKLRAVLEITRNVGTSLKTEEVLPRIMDSLFEIFPQAKRGYILESIRSGREFTPTALKARGDAADTISPISAALAGRVMKDGTAFLSGNVQDDSSFGDSIFDEEISSVICAPLMGPSKQALGVIHIEAVDPTRPFTPDDLEVLASVAVLAGQAVEHARTHETLLRMETQRRDIELAKNVQLQFLPRSKPMVDEYNFYHHFSAARDVAGDYFDYIELTNNRLAIVIGDVSGKGVSAAMVVAKLCSDVRHSLLSTDSADAGMNRLNQYVCRNISGGMFVTMLLCVLDYAQHTLTLVSAGHLTPYLRYPGTAACIGLCEENRNLPLGIETTASFDSQSIQMTPGSVVTCYTDGISEAMNPDGDLYGSAALRRAIEGTDYNAVHVGQAVLADAKRFAAGRLQSDDMCIVCFGREQPK